MDFVTRQFIVLAKKLRKELRKSLSDLQGALQQQTRAISNHYASEQQDQHTQPPIQVFAELHTPEDVERRRSASEGRQYRLQWWLTVGTWFTFIAATVYAGIAARQLQQLKKATEASEKATIAATNSATTAAASLKSYQGWSEISTRPYLGLEKVVLIGRPTANQQLGVQVQLRNSGKSPAESAACRNCSIFLRTSKGIQSNYTHYDLPPIDVAADNYRTMMLWTDKDLEQTDVSALANGTMAVYIKGQIEYRNIYDSQRSYTFAFCYFYEATGWENALGPCEGPPPDRKQRPAPSKEH